MRLEPVREDGMVGLLAWEGDEPAGIPVLLLGGSEGGVPRYWAEALAPKGFACFALAYFSEDGLPPTLEEIPLEYFERALAWFAAHTASRGQRAAVVGASKGAELALLLASTFPERVRAVAAVTPGSMVFEGIGRFGRSRRSSWAHRGEPLPFLPYPKGARPRFTRRGMALAPMYDGALDAASAADLEAAAIPVERIDGPILLISGDDDQMWPASRMSQMVAARLAEYGRADRLTHLRYEHAGHLLDRKRRAMTRGLHGRLYDYGGTDEGDGAAGDDSWPKLIRFLATAPP